MSCDRTERLMVGFGFFLFESNVFRSECVNKFDETLDLFWSPLVRLLLCLNRWKVIDKSALGTLH